MLEDANKLRALIGRTGDAAAGEERAEAAGRGDCSNGSDELPDEAKLLLLSARLVAFKEEFELESLYKAAVGRNGMF